MRAADTDHTMGRANMCRFHIEANQVTFFLGDKPLYSTPEISFFFDGETGTLFKHGPRQAVEQVWREHSAAYAKAGIKDMDLVVVTFKPHRFDEELFSRFVNTSGFIGLWYRQQPVSTLDDVLTCESFADDVPD